MSSQHETRGGIEGKTCSRCHEWKPLIHFALNRREKDGLECGCRICEAKTVSRWDNKRIAQPKFQVNALRSWIGRTSK